MIALTTSSWPSIAAENSDGRAPLEIRYSAIGLLPMWEAAPSADSQSPKPQSHVARARDGRDWTNSLTWLRLKCETVTISRVSSGDCAGNVSVTASRFDASTLSATSIPATGSRNPLLPKGSATEASFSKLRRDQTSGMPHLRGSNPVVIVFPALLPGKLGRSPLGQENVRRYLSEIQRFGA